MEKSTDSTIEQIPLEAVITGFMQMWYKFGSIIPGELEKIRETMSGLTGNAEVYRDNDIEHFFRLSSVMCYRESMTMGELSATLNVPLSTATRIVDWLVNRGLAQRLPDADDRRVVRISLTEGGRETHNTILGYVKKRLSEMLELLTPDEQVRVLSLIFEIKAIAGKLTR